jgi:tripartite-type tricarboxylate transporter receptor subunit TctC
MHRRTLLACVLHTALALGITTLSPSAVAQQAYPNKQIRFVVPFAAGGGGDAVARLLAQRLGEQIGDSVAVENKAGAGGIIGSSFVLKSPPDGYTVLNMSSTYAIQAAIGKNLNFDPIKDMQPIIMVSRDPVVMIVRTNSPLNDAKELIAAAKAKPGKLTHGSAGIGSIAHLGTEELAFLMGISLVHVPYKGSSQAFSDLLGGNVDMMLTSATFASPYIKSGRVKAIGIAGKERMPNLPDVKTFEEQGIKGYNVVDWKAVAGPKGMPADAVKFLNTELNKVLQHKSVTDRFSAEGTTSVGGTPEYLLQTIVSDIDRWKRVIKEANIKFE